MRREARLFFVAFVAALLFSDASANVTKRIVLIGGVKSEWPARHDYPDGIALLKTLLESSPDIRPAVTVDAYLDGWPADPAAHEQRCAVCHHHPQGNVPPRELIAKRSRQRIVETLTHGSMRPFAEGFSANEIEAIARYLQ